MAKDKDKPKKGFKITRRTKAEAVKDFNENLMPDVEAKTGVEQPRIKDDK